MKYKLSIGQRLKNVRKTVLNVTQKEMAEVLSTKGNSLSRFENGIYDLSLKQIIQLKEAYRINPTWLLTGEGNMFLGEDVKSDHQKGEGLKENDLNLIEEIIVIFEKGCKELDINLTPEGKAKIVIKLFELFKEEPDHKINQEEIIRLIKFASYIYLKDNNSLE